MRSWSVIVAAAAMGTLVVASQSGASDLVLGGQPDTPGIAPLVYGPNWTGWYAGAHAGYGWADIDGIYDSSQNLISERTDLGSIGNIDGFVGGAQFGYNQQYGSFVIGFEGDFSGSDMSGVTLSPEISGADYVSIELDQMASIRGRLGYAYGSSLLYGTVGYAHAWYTMDAQDFSANGGQGVGRAGFDEGGVVYGGGIEVALTDALSFGVEYLHADIDLNENLFNTTLTANPDVDPDDFLTSDGVDIVRARLNVKLCSFAQAC